MKGHLKGLRNALETHRKKWCNEVNEIDAKRRMVSEATVMSLLQSEERRRAFEKRWGEARELAMADLDEGTFTGEVEIIGLRPPEVKGEKRASGEVRTEEKKTFLRPLEEKPEGLGRYFVGGSSGSTEGKKDQPEMLLGKYFEGGSSGSTEEKKYEKGLEEFDDNGCIVPAEAPEVEDPPPMPPPSQGPIVPVEASPVEVAPSGPIMPVEASPVEVAPSAPIMPAEAPVAPVVAPEAPVVAPSPAVRVMQRISEAHARLDRKAYVTLEDEFVRVAKAEDLRPEDRAMYERLRGTGPGVCPRCRWVNGCEDCDEEKAWGFACRATLWHTADEALRPVKKPRGRPKKAA